MNIKLPRQLWFLLSFLLLLALYWPALNGTPIWDDNAFWFMAEVCDPSTPYSTIWRNYAWPFSVSLQKFILSFLGDKYFYYHLINLSLHFTNSVLVYKLGRYLHFRYPFFYFLLFLLHPVAVITTAWMIQIKTLLCFFFALASLLAFLKGQKAKRWLILSWLLFGLSILSKSASLTVPVLFLILSLKLNGWKKVHWLIPFFIFSGWSAYKVLKSPVTKLATEKAAVAIKIKEEPVPEIKTAPPGIKPKPAPVVASAPKVTSEIKKPVEVRGVPAKPLGENSQQKRAMLLREDLSGKPHEIYNSEIGAIKFFGVNLGLIAQTMNYYFWQSFAPIVTEPVRGMNYQRAGFMEIVHVLFLLIMVVLFWKDSGLVYLGTAHFLLIPFLGLIPAPFMNITWVSDQHLYLALPALLAFWMRILDKIKWQRAVILPIVFSILFSWKTWKSSYFYQDQFVFYEKVLEYNPTNIPIAYNLAHARIKRGELNLAYDVVKETFYLGMKDPVIRKNHYFPYITLLYQQLKRIIERTHAN